MRFSSILTAGSSSQTLRAAGVFLWLSGFNISRSITRDTGLYYRFPRQCLLLDVYVISTHSSNHTHGSSSNLGGKWGGISVPRLQHKMDETKERKWLIYTGKRNDRKCWITSKPIQATTGRYCRYKQYQVRHISTWLIFMAILSICETRLKWILYSENAPAKSNELRSDICDCRWQAVTYCRLMKRQQGRSVYAREKCVKNWINLKGKRVSCVIRMVAECKEMPSLNWQPGSPNFRLQNPLSLLRLTKHESTFLSNAPKFSRQISFFGRFAFFAHFSLR